MCKKRIFPNKCYKIYNGYNGYKGYKGYKIYNGYNGYRLLTYLVHAHRGRCLS